MNHISYGFKKRFKPSCISIQAFKRQSNAIVKIPKIGKRKSTKSDLKILSLETVKKMNDFLDEDNTFYIGLNIEMRVSEVCALTGMLLILT
jgi:hypothetical protein